MYSSKRQKHCYSGGGEDIAQILAHSMCGGCHRDIQPCECGCGCHPHPYYPPKPPMPPDPRVRPGRFLSSYIEALGDAQTVARNANVVFDVDPDLIDNVGNNITVNQAGTIFTIHRTGLYYVNWTVNIGSEDTGENAPVLGLLENGESLSGASNAAKGSFSSGAVIEVSTVPYTISLFNFNNAITLTNPTAWGNAAASIRIIRFADGPSV